MLRQGVLAARRGAPVGVLRTRGIERQRDERHGIAAYSVPQIEQDVQPFGRAEIRLFYGVGLIEQAPVRADYSEIEQLLTVPER